MTTQERLSALDTSFLHLETPTTPMHISSLAVYEGPAPAAEELRSHLEQRLPLVPRFSQRLEHVPLNGHRPVWVCDPEFDLDTHLHHVALPAPGTETQLRDLAGRILSQPLCRAKPLWEMWLIDGLERGRFAVLSKTHHALWDGVSGVDLHSVLLDAEADPGLERGIEPSRPDPPPTRAQVATAALRDHVAEGWKFVRGAFRTVREPRRTLRTVAEFAAGGAALAASMVRPAPPCSLNGGIGSGRRYAMGRASLDHVRRLKKHYGTTVNDAVLASVAGGLRHWQVHRGVEPRDMKVMVPVSVRDPGDREAFGNRVVMVVVPLPVTQEAPVLRLRTVHASMQLAKSSAQISAGKAFVQMSELLPPAVVAGISRAQAYLRSFNLLVTNIPGPGFPLYLRGRRLLELFPQAPLAANQGLSVAALSYDGRISFGLLADHKLLPDIDVLAEGIERSMDELTSKVVDYRPATDRIPAWSASA